jgi:ribosome-binding factor A
VQDHAKHIDELLATARESDAEIQRMAAGKEYAGDPQPYKLEDDEDVEVPAGEER